MTLTDTHTHPYYAEDPTGFVDRSISAGVTRLILPNVSTDSIEPMKRLAELYPENIRMSMGLHPTEVKEDADEKLDIILGELDNDRQYVALGEIGIDLYWDKSFCDRQMKAFDRQLASAAQKQLPVIIHCREGLDQTLEILKGYPSVRAVFHSFGGTPADVERILCLNDSYYFGINGIVTFKNSRLRETLPAIPIDRLLLETDSPYLAPVPHRGKTNESAYMVHVADTVAATLGLSTERIAEVTSANSRALFSF